MKKKRKTKRKKKRKSRLKHVLFIVLAIPFLIWATIFIPRYVKKGLALLPLDIRGFQTYGARSFSSENVQSMAGVNKGSPLLGTWVENLIEKIQLKPQIKKVSVVRSLTGNVQVQVAERDPVAIVDLGEFRYVDQKGNILHKVNLTRKDLSNLVIISGPWSGKVLQLATNQKLNKELQVAISLVEDLVEMGIQKKDISKIHFHKEKGWVVFRSKNLAPIVFGQNKFDLKIKRLRQVLIDTEPFEEAVREIDLDYRDQVVVKLKKHLAKGVVNG